MASSRRALALACLTTLAVILAPGVARPQNTRDCAWPIELSPDGSGNFLAPEHLARYWAMPFSREDGTITIRGTYPDARYFSIAAYNTDAKRRPTEAAGVVHDAGMAPDPGTVNPFVKPGGKSGTYTVTISHSGQNSGNSVRVGSDFSWIALRMYVPGSDPDVGGRSLTGGVPLPTVSRSRNGVTQELKPCWPVNKLADTRAFLETLLPTGFDLIGDEGTPASDRLWFAAPTVPPPLLMPNPNNKYLAMFPGNRYQPGRIIVIRARAPGFPDTIGGAPVWTPKHGFRTVDVRFWSICNNDFELPVGTVNCTTDGTARLEGDRYTIVISNDLLRPKWLPGSVNWLPWGDEQYMKLVFLRNMLPSPGFHQAAQDVVKAGCTFDFDLPQIPPRAAVDKAGQCARKVMGDYYPEAFWCDKETFLRGGWKACARER